MNSLDLALLPLFNSWVSYSASTFYEALEWSNKPSWIIAACAMVAMWFSGHGDTARPGSRHDSRQRVILLLLALVLAFATARAISGVLDRPRPIALADAVGLQAPIHPAVWQRVKNAMQMHGAFPSDHGAMFAVMTVGVFLANRWAGLLALAINIAFAVMRIGIGFHWPSDMLGGEMIGVAITLALLRLQPYLNGMLDWLLELWERHAWLSYPLGFLFLLDFSQKFAALFTGIGMLKHALLR